VCLLLGRVPWLLLLQLLCWLHSMLAVLNKYSG
jgi:hypothetical protein